MQAVGHLKWVVGRLRWVVSCLRDGGSFEVGKLVVEGRMGEVRGKIR